MLKFIEAKKRMLEERNINLNAMVDCLMMYQSTNKELWLDSAKELGRITNQIKKDLDNNDYRRYYSYLDEDTYPLKVYE